MVRVLPLEVFLDRFADDRGEVVADLELPVVSDETTVVVELEVGRRQEISAVRIGSVTRG